MRRRSLGEWLQWQSTLHPSAIDLGLERCRRVRDALGLGASTLPRIVVAGTNGKGSCVALLEAMLTAAGLRAGAYSSPHLVRYNERVRIGTREVSDAVLVEAFERVDAARGDVSLTFFEFGTLAAADIIERARVDVAVMEVGLGGRLDAVNAFEPSVSLITAIGVDHRAWLGDDRESGGRARKPESCAVPCHASLASARRRPVWSATRAPSEPHAGSSDATTDTNEERGTGGGGVRIAKWAPCRIPRCRGVTRSTTPRRALPHSMRCPRMPW